MEHGRRTDSSLAVESPGDWLTLDLSPSADETPLLVVPAEPALPGELRQPLVRLFDIVVSVGAILLLAPLMLAIAVGVKVTSRGPVLYGSERIGRRNTVFRAWKFRSMLPDADARLAELLWADETARLEYENYRKIRHDPRVTPFGRFLRKTSLDELPQLFNILSGQMSVVGPRPKLLNEAELFGDALDLILAIRPGLTGLWQVSGRSNVSVGERVQLDLQYVESRTLVGDVVICVKTVGQLLRPDRHGAV